MPSRRKPLVPSRAARSKLRHRSRPGRRTPRSSRRHRFAAGVGAGAPTIRSSKPSPLTSPAPLTGQPRSHTGRCRRGGSRWCRRGRRDRALAPNPSGVAEHHVALAGEVSPPAPPNDAPTIRSSKPSPLTSPAAATEHAARYPARRCRRGGSRWCRRGSARSRLAAKPRGSAEHHVALAGIEIASRGQRREPRRSGRRSRRR